MLSQAQYVGRNVGTEQVRVIQRTGQGIWEQREGVAYLIWGKNEIPASIPKQREENSLCEAEGKAGVQAQR